MLGKAMGGPGERTRQSSEEKRTMKLLVFGATGGTGREIVARALAQGHVVTVFVRNPAAISTKHDHLKLVQGNVLDYASVEAAIQGQDAVVSALGAEN